MEGVCVHIKIFTLKKESEDEERKEEGKKGAGLRILSCVQKYLM